MHSLREWTYYPITTRSLRVLRVGNVTPGMRRVTLGGDGLKAHVAPNGHAVHAFRSEGFDDEFKLFLRHPEVDAALVPEQRDGVLDWPRSPHLVSRTYTVRRWDPEAGELDVDLVLHGDGPAVRWATSVQVGDAIDIAGPKMSGGLPVGADWCLIAGDETALPAIGRWLDDWPTGVRAQIFVEVANRAHVQDLPTPEGVEMTWVVRDAGGCSTGSSTPLFDAVSAADWWDGTVFAWAAGESLSLVPLRRWLRDDRGLDRSQLDITGYWRAAPLHETLAEPEPADAPRHDVVDLDHVAELVTPVALRVAMTIGLSSALGGAPLGLAELAAATGCDAAGLSKLLRYLESVGIVDRASTEAGAQVYAWAPAYRELDDDWFVSKLSLDSPHGLRDLGVLSLLSAVRTGRGRDPEAALRALDIATDDPDDLARRARADADAADADVAYLASPLAESDLFDGATDIRISGRGAGALARAIRTEHPDLRVRVRPAGADDVGHQGDVENEPGGLFEPARDTVDMHILVDALADYPDDAATAVLRTARLAARKVVLVGESLETSCLDEHECEADLIAFATCGGGLRTRAELDRLASHAGLGLVHTATVGWGFHVHVHG